MSASMPTLFGRATAIYKDHANLRETVGYLREFCIKLLDSDSSTQPDPSSAINYFLHQLRVHFAAEEDPGYFDTLVVSHPVLSDEVKALRADHVRILETAESLRVLALHDTDSLVLARDLSRLLDHFEAHERRETRTLHEFLQHG